MFVQSKSTIHPKHVNGMALKQRRASQETLVQWSNGDRQWVETEELKGDIVLIGSNQYDEELYSNGY